MKTRDVEGLVVEPGLPLAKNETERKSHPPLMVFYDFAFVCTFV